MMVGSTRAAGNNVFKTPRKLGRALGLQQTHQAGKWMSLGKGQGCGHLVIGSATQL